MIVGGGGSTASAASRRTTRRHLKANPSIERFCMLHAAPDVRSTSARALEDAHLDEAGIRALLFRIEEQTAADFPFPAYSPETVLDWSWAKHATSDRRVLVPTSLVGRVPRGSTRLVHGTSNGYACHPRAEAASRAALLEVIERDAVLLAWYLARRLPRIEPDVDLELGGEVYAWLATQDIDVPVVLMAALLPKNVTRVAAAAGASFDEAFARATDELRALATSPASATRAVGTAAREGAPIEHQRYFDGAGRSELARLAADADTVGASTLRARWPTREPTRDNGLMEVVGALERVRLEAWFVELSWGTAARRLASPRVHAALDAGERLNPLPHPLA